MRRNKDTCVLQWYDKKQREDEEKKNDDETKRAEQKFKTVQGPNCLVLNKVMSLTFVQGSILGGIAVLHAQIGPPSTKLGQAFFCCGRGPNIYQLWTGWADLSM